MKGKLLLGVFLLTQFTILSVRSQNVPVLVSVQWLNENLSMPNLVILQVNALRLDYEKEHIAGARFLWPGWLAPDSPEGTYNAPDPAKATEILQGLGISSDSHVVLCHVRNEVGPAARMFLTLEHLGLKGRVSFLNGGLDAWKKAGNPVTKDLPVVKKGNFKANPTGLLVDRFYVQDKLNTGASTIIDARLKRFYDGEPSGYPRDGHITGAKNIPYAELLNANNFFKPADSLQILFTPVAPAKDKELVSYCFVGQSASVVYLAGRALGYNMKLYDGSMQEWSRIDQCPMEKSPDKN
ncbi:MAG: sulfurtransferase [Cyclobacteriaceae bacterium]|nr:sulfurtransferase [Cyclobacteriaceae bacterium]